MLYTNTLKSRMKAHLIPALLSLTLAFPASADEENNPKSAYTISNSLTAVSDYTNRGIDQTDRNPTVQATLDVQHESGLKLGAFVSGVTFADAHLEFDPYVSYAKTVDGLNLEGGIVYNSYPGTSRKLNYSYAEFFTNISYDFQFTKLTASLNYAPNFAGDAGTAYYPRLTAEVPLPDDFALKGWVGHQSVSDNDAAGFKNYTDWSAAITYSFQPYTVGLQYTGSSLGESHDGGARFIVSLSWGF